LSQEPTFLPKVQIYFADFPYSHFSNWSEAANLGYPLRFLVRLSTPERLVDTIYSQNLIFSYTYEQPHKPQGSLLKPSNRPFTKLSTSMPIRNKSTVNKEKRQLFWALTHTSQASIWLHSLRGSIRGLPAYHSAGI